jgi:dihydroorotase
MTADLVVKNGTLVSHLGEFPGTGVAVRDGKITMIAKDADLPAGLVVFDAQGSYILPGLIDCHVHFREPGLTYKEDFATGSAAAAAGGVTCVMDMPNTLPPVIDPSSVGIKSALANNRSWVDVAMFGLVVQENVDKLVSMGEAGIAGYKCFLGQTEAGDASPLPPDDGALLSAMTAIATTGLRFAFHAENHAVMRSLIAALKAAGRTDVSAHLESRPVVVELEAIQRVALFAQATGCKIHICHLSSSEGVQMVCDWKRRGVDITCETSANYCFLSCDDLRRTGAFLRINPPLRQQEQGAALLDAVVKGEIDVIASDHAPHSIAEKTVTDIWAVRAGMIGVETSAQLFLSRAVRYGRMTLSRFVQATSYHPSRAWNLFPRKGVIAVGADADITVVDMNKEWRISDESLHSKCALSPFSGWTGVGVPTATIIRGNVVMKDGRLIGNPVGRTVGPVREMWKKQRP